MAKIDDRDLAVGRLYAEAMLGLAEERGQSDALLDELRELVDFLDQNPKVEHFLASQMVDEEGRARVLDDLLRGQASDLLLDSLQVINRKGRLGQLRAIAESYRIALRDLRGWVDVHVRTAVPLDGAQRTRLQDVLAASTGRKPTLVERIDPSLIGGIVVEVAGKKFDASVASRLHDLSEALLARASREIHSGTAYVAES
ncbi:MAG: F-type H+-transporting ATPase subunit delta [Acidobacteriota bacterium]|jgi:F-type H+-transporting ATPase subunit delta|nr:F-type H+-transporting ATPase subunit delta [Acidobacteriota bacterium]